MGASIVCAQQFVRTAALLQSAEDRALRWHSLSSAARGLLATIESASEPLPQTTLAERLALTGASVSSLVDTLERKALVRRVRSVSDRRVALVELADAAYPLVDGYLAETRTLRTPVFAALDPAELETLSVLLARVAVPIEAIDVDAVLGTTLPRGDSRHG